MATTLKSIYDKAKSFYGKATITDNGDFLILKSYNTNILKFDKTTKKIEFLAKAEWCFSNTTNRHINEFLQQYTSETKKTKKELLKMALAN